MRHGRHHQGGGNSGPICGPRLWRLSTMNAQRGGMNPLVVAAPGRVSQRGRLCEDGDGAQEIMWGDVRRARFFCLLLAPQMLASVSAEAEQIKLGVTLQLPITSHIGVNLVQFKDEVHKRTKGAVAVEVHD